MKIVIKTKNIKLEPELKKYIQEKISSLEGFKKIFQQKKFFKKEKIETRLEIGKETLHHKKGPYFKAYCQIHLPGKILKAEAVSKTIQGAIIKVRDELHMGLKQYREKLISKSLRRARALKKSFHLSSGARFWRKGRIRDEGT
ncbi:HPF/RaiA family ribosome-associated protein [Patescibacteria group bacterium]